MKKLTSLKLQWAKLALLLSLASLWTRPEITLAQAKVSPVALSKTSKTAAVSPEKINSLRQEIEH